MTKTLRFFFLSLTLVAVSATTYAQELKADLATGDPFICEGTPLNFNNKSTGFDSIVWYFGNGDTSRRLKLFYTYNNIGSKKETYNVKLVAFGKGKTDTAFRDVVVEGAAKAIFRDSIIATWVQFYHKCENYLGLQWDFGDGKTQLTDGVPISHFYTKEGTYDVSLVANTDFGCNDTFRKTLVLVDSTGDFIAEQNPYKLEVYPNPFTDLSVFAFELNSDKTLKVSVNDVQGRVIYYRKQQFPVGRTEINLGSILKPSERGLYLLSISDEESTYIVKLQKH